MKLEDIQKEWAKDAHIKDSQLDREAIRIPILHSKYYDILLVEKRQYHALLESKRGLEWILENLLRKKLSREEMEFFDVELPDKTVLAPEVPKAVSNDKHMIKLNLRIALQNDKIEFVKSILHEVRGRSFQIRDAIEFRKLTAGA